MNTKKHTNPFLMTKVKIFTIRRSAVTLLELLVVMALLSVAAGIVGIGINKALVDQRFRTEVGLVIDELRLAQDLMLILGTDVHLKFTKNDDGKKGIKYWLELETQLPNSIESELLKRERVLKTVRAISFNDFLDDSYTEGLIDVRFLSKGAIMSKGIMHFSTSEDGDSNALQAFAVLSGYPRPINSIDDKEKADAAFKALENTTFDDALTQDTFAKLPEKVKKPDEVPKAEKDKEEAKKEEKNSSPSSPNLKPGRAPQ